MYEVDVLNNHNFKDLIRLNKIKTNFNILNKDFMELYNNCNHFKKLLLKKRLKLLKKQDFYIGYIWPDSKTGSTCEINCMYVMENQDNLVNAYKYLLNSIKVYSTIIYNCEKNHYNYEILKILGFKISSGFIEMNMSIEKPFNINIPDNLSFARVIIGRDEKLRCVIQNSVFNKKGRIPLQIEDIYYDEMQDYYVADGSIFLKLNNHYIGYGQIIIKDNCPYIVNFGILKFYRKRGLSKIFLKFMINILYNKGYKLVKIKVDIKNYIALNLYKSIGFVENIQQSKWYLSK